MSTEQARMDPAGAAEPQGAPGEPPPTKAPEANLADELREFGRQLESVFYAARTSPRSKEIEQQLTSAWRDVETRINSVLNRAQTSDLRGTVSNTAQSAADEVQGGLARGLRSLNDWMSRQVREAEERRKKREQELSQDTLHDARDEVRDRFGSNPPSFGHDVQVPMKTTPEIENAPDIISERFQDK